MQRFVLIVTSLGLVYIYIYIYISFHSNSEFFNNMFEQWVFLLQV